ncbi:MAG: AMP-binding protein [Candidatus Omnitrophica bacterium]|nr:AMP-binding protein [Candidatus Omnitrophota bacterium]
MTPSMIPFKTAIKWIDIQGRVRTCEPGDFREKCLKACAFFRDLEAERFTILWEPSPEALAMFTGGLLAGKLVCFYSIPNFKLDPEYFHRQIRGLRQQGLHTVGSPRFGYLDLDTVFDMRKSRGRAEPVEGYPMDFMQFSSGTTGIRKRITYSGRKLISYVDEFSRVLGLQSDDTIATWTPHYHDEGLIYGFLLPLLTGSDILIMSNLDWVMNPEAFLDACCEYRPAFLTQPNFAYSLMEHRCRERDLSFMKCYSVGEVVDHQDCLAFEKKFNTGVVGALGLAEAIYAVTDSDDNTSHLNSVRNSGRCFGENQIRIVDGEIVLKSPYLFEGYDTGEESRIYDGWYHTGDEGVIRDGLLYVLGRRDSVFKVRGQKVLPELIETQVNRIPGVKKGRNVCFGVDRAGGGKKAVLLYEGTASEREVANTASALDIEIIRNVPDGWLIKSSSGKISRKYCREKYLKEQAEA